MTLSILSVAYPFAPVRSDTPGGAEQVLLTLDRGLTERGCRSTVIAQEGSIVSGALVPLPAIDPVDEATRDGGRALWREAITRELARRPVDLVHLHGIDFASYLPPPGTPALVTLHAPLSWYSDEALRPTRPHTFLHCVSAAQERTGSYSHFLPPIENGVAVPDLRTRDKADYALMLTRVCPEKGVHHAMDAAKEAGVELIIAGKVFPYPEHQAYFQEEISPRLDSQRRLIEPVGGARKSDLLAKARCLIVSSEAEETSSLVAREALAAGTPVVAFARGALRDVVEHGRTGFLVQDVPEMARAIRSAAELDPVACNRAARERFSETLMLDRYLALYRTLARGRVGAVA